MKGLNVISWMDSQVQGDVSFIDLLQGDTDMDNSFLDESQQASMSIDHSQPQVIARTKKPQRGTNFSMEEDKLLVSSWLNVGMDAVQGADQKHRQFWERVHKYFHEHKEFPSDRNYGSLMNRWSTIQKSVTMFTACLSQIEHLNQSGTTEHDKIQKAKCVYRSKNNNVVFPYEHCWNLLKGEQKWLHHGNKDKRRRRSSMETSANVTHTPDSINEGEGDNVSHGNNVDFERPIGRKAEKANRKRKERPSEDVVEFMKKKTECLEEARVQGEEIIRLEKEKLQLEQLDREKIMDIELKKLHLQELEWQQKMDMERQKLQAEQMDREKIMDFERKRLHLQGLEREEKMDIERKKLQSEQLDREERAMILDTSKMTELQQQYWKARQNEIIECQESRKST